MASNNKAPLNVLLGTANIGDSEDPLVRFDGPEEVAAILNAFAERGYHQVDGARGHPANVPGGCEPRLAAAGAGKRFTIDSKVMSFQDKLHTQEKIAGEIDATLRDLGIQQINIEYLHSPDRDTPFEEPIKAMNLALKAGKIKHWGLCSYPASEVQQILDICDKHGYVKPSVYQGHYNAAVRGGEKELFPILRKHGIAFYAFSPAGGGFFAHSYENEDCSHFDSNNLIGAIYSSLYIRDPIIAAVEKALAVAEKHGIDGHECALRWVTYHSLLSKDYGDAMIIGSSTIKQLGLNLDSIERGPLPDDVATAFGAIFEDSLGDDEDENIIPYHF